MLKDVGSDTLNKLANSSEQNYALNNFIERHQSESKFPKDIVMFEQF